MYLCSVKDALAVESDIRVVHDACQQQFDASRGKGTEADGLSVEQFQAACEHLANVKGFENFRELAEDKGLAAAVYSRSMHVICIRIRTSECYRCW